jgi:hypothetical protein
MTTTSCAARRGVSPPPLAAPVAIALTIGERQPRRLRPRAPRPAPGRTPTLSPAIGCTSRAPPVAPSPTLSNSGIGASRRATRRVPRRRPSPGYGPAVASAGKRVPDLAIRFGEQLWTQVRAAIPIPFQSCGSDSAKRTCRSESDLRNLKWRGVPVARSEVKRYPVGGCPAWSIPVNLPLTASAASLMVRDFGDGVPSGFAPVRVREVCRPNWLYS